MSTVRIQIRRGTSTEWTSVNPVLAGGEAGFESDTKKIKIGDGTSTWTALGYATVTPAQLQSAIAGVVAGEIASYATLTELSDAISQEVTDRNAAIVAAIETVGGADFIGIGEKGAANGVAELDSSGHVPDAQIPAVIARDSEVSSATATAKSEAISSARSYSDTIKTEAISTSKSYIDDQITSLINFSPAALDTLGEIASQLASDESAVSALTTTVASKAPSSNPYFTGAARLPANTTIGTITATEIGYIAGVESSIQSQINEKLSITAADSTYETKSHATSTFATKNDATFTGNITLPSTTQIGNASSTQIGFLDGVTSAIQTQLDSKLNSSTAASTYLTISAASTGYDAYGAASTAESNAESYTANRIGDNTVNGTTSNTVKDRIATAKSQAISTAESYADSLASNYDAAGTATTAKNDAKSYADGLISTEVTNRNSAIATAKSQAISTAEGYTDSAISNLVNASPSTLDTLKELADAIGDDPSFAVTVSSHIATAKSDAEEYTDSSIATEVTNRNSAISSAVATGKSQAISTSEAYTDSAILTEVSNRNTAIGTSLSTAESYTDTAKSAAISTSESYTDTAISTEVTNRNSAILTAKNAAIATSEGYTDTAISTEVTNRNSAIATSLTTAEGYTDTAKSAAISTSEGYTDTAISTEVTNRNSAIATAKSQAITTSEGYADSVIATEVSNRNTAISNATANMVQTTDTGSVTSTMILNGTIVNADINAAAAIAYSKLNLASSITSADIVDGTIVNADISTSAGIADTKLATISTSNKVSNSATTATDANTASAIVARDASGNFTANLITVNTNPTSAGHAASKAYVDNISAGLNWHTAVVAATSGALPSSTYADGTTDANGGLGIGATLTATTNAQLAIDAVSATNGSRVLIKNQADAKQNGIYFVTDKGSASTKWILTRATDADNHVINEVCAGDAVYVLYGTVNTNQSFVATMTGSGTDGLVLIGTDNMTWTQFSGASTFVAGNGLVRTGNTVDVVSSTLNVTADSVDLATVSQSNTTGGNLANGIVSAITVDSYGRVTGYQTGAQNVASTSSKGIASFDPASFTVTSGNVAIKSAGISNSQLANNSVTIGSTSVSLGGTASTLAGLTLTTPVIAQITNTGTLTLPTSTDTLVGRATTDTLTNKSISGSTNTLSNIGNTSLTNSSITINGNAVSLGGSVSGLATNASPTFTGTVTLPLTTAGYVTTTSGGAISSVATIPNSGLTNSSVTVGTTAIALGASSTTLAGLTSVTSTAFAGALTGNVSGNASTATALATPRNINGVAFDGSAAITITAANPNALTIGTGLSGTSYTGSGAVTIAIDSTVATLTGSQTLTNKTLSSAVATGGITYNGATSGTIVVKASDVAGSNTLTFPAATDTLVGKATTDTLTNKTFDTAGTGNVFKIAGTQISTNTGTGANVLAASPTLSGTLSAAAITTTGDVTVGGNLTVNGTTTTINSTTLNTTEQVLVISNTATPTDVTANGAGITIKGATDKTVKWYSSTGALTSSENIDLASGKTYKINGTDVLTATAVGGRTIPASNIVGLTDTQTLTNKTLTSPSLGTPTVTGTLTTSASGITFSDATVQTVAGVPSVTPIDNSTFATGTVNLASGLKDYMVKVGANVTITLQQDSAATYPIGTSIDFWANGTGALFAAGTGVTIVNTPGLKFRAVGSVATAMKVAANTWLVFGDLSA
jgi:hypothetical protein